MAFYFAQFLSGLAQAATLFLVAAGLSLIFGVTRVVNFAHGSFYMMGAYLAYSLAERLGPLGFWPAVVLAAVCVGAAGAAVEVVVLRRTYRSPELFQLLATFGVVLVVADLMRALYGPEDRLGARAPGLSGSIRVFGQAIPEYDLFLIVVGPLVLLGLWLLLRRTRWGTLVRAATQDREMTMALGVNQRSLFTAVFFLGSALAGLAGALQVPREAINLHMDMGVIVEAFVVVVIGGLGRIGGAFIAAVLIGELQAFGILIFPQITLVLIFLIMAVVLTVRPYGLLGRPPGMVRAASEASAWQPYRPHGRAAKLAAAGVALALAALPFVAGDYGVIVVTEMLILALFAASLQFLMGPGGLISFGHAAYFGLGAYAAALLVKHLDTGMSFGLLAAPIVAGLAALAFGWFCVRLTGVYLAMLTLAFAQIVWSVTFQWYAFTGGDNGILGVWPAGWAAAKPAFYTLSLLLCGGGLWLLQRIIFAPFGYALRACRDSPLRAGAIGINARRQQWLAFAIAGGCAGLAGGLYAFAKGSVFPNLMGIPLSVDALVMVLLGGVDTLTGPIAGAVVFHGLKTEVLRYTDFWQLVLGCTIIALVIAFPQGIMGALAGAIESARENRKPGLGR